MAKGTKPKNEKNGMEIAKRPMLRAVPIHIIMKQAMTIFPIPDWPDSTPYQTPDSPQEDGQIDLSVSCF
ncbi:MAG: hypothetical protein ACXADC_08245 [Candidatus Thorarchaeota archaeon]|jgi:hypothetical protein